MSFVPIDRLSSLDRAFLTIESGPLHMHVGAVAVFDGHGLVASDGALDALAIRDAIGRSLASIPRFRQRVRFFPLLGTVWSPDPSFDLDFHVRHTAIPRPGSIAQLHALAGRLFSQCLDRERPLWEMWLVEGLEGGRFAIVTKAHHAMLDGVAGVTLLASLFALEPHPLAGGPVRAESLRPTETEPSRLDYVRALVRHRLDELPVLRRRVRELATSGRGQVRTAVSGVIEMIEGTLGAVTSMRPTPLNPERIGPHRAFEGVRLPLASLQRARRALGCTLNDVGLAVVTGALRRLFVSRGVVPSEVGPLRALVPVNLRARESGARGGGNRVAMLLAELPVHLEDPRARLSAIARSTAALKGGSHEIEAAELAEELGDLGPESLMGLVFDAALHLLPFHVIVTNVPGPSVPLYLGPSRLESLYPLVPLFARQSVGIALLSYDGGLFVGLNADRGSMPDLGALTRAIEASADEIVALAGA
ncbi:MAG: wax ester/triacylglycerol synthase family O-acyltransferase [Sandaracinaceae bacterium]|nr:wax ester/triacylglycerol synthase family O-acyltransferase [Sandaracinaceae bacterium]